VERKCHPTLSKDDSLLGKEISINRMKMVVKEVGMEWKVKMNI